MIKPTEPPPKVCMLCDGELDQYAKINECGYCSNCMNPIGSFQEILNYFKIPIQREPLVVKRADGTLREIPWPDPKSPDLWHEKACKLFPKWEAIVSKYKELKGIRHFGVDELRDMIEYVREHTANGKYEEVAMIKRDSVLAVIEAELVSGAIHMLKVDHAPSLLGRDAEGEHQCHSHLSNAVKSTVS